MAGGKAIPPAATKHLLLLLALVCVWAISWPVMKVGVASVPPLWFACLRYLVGSATLGTIVAWAGRLRIPPRQDWPLVLVSGVLQMAVFAALTGTALTILPAGRASVLAYSTPIWVVPLAAWPLREDISRSAAVGALIGISGVGMIAGLPSGGGAPKLAAQLMLVGAAASWAISILYVRRHRFAATALELAPWQMFVATLLLLTAALCLEGPIPAVNAAGAAALLYVGPCATGFAYWAMVQVGRHFSPSTISMSLLAVPALGILASSIALGEAIDSALAGGGILIALGIVLTATRRFDQLR